ncbi:MAG: OmpA family protein [Betaproteobacteria bacterium]
MKSARAFILVGIVCTSLSGVAFSQEPRNPGYVVDTNRTPAAVMSGTGLCWHTSIYTVDAGIPACDPNALTDVHAPATPLASAPERVKVVPFVEAPLPAAASLAEPHKINLSADAFFDFDKATLKPQGRTLLDELVAQLADTKYDTISVVGHTDRIGSDDYNLTLSNSRANAVKAYLVGRGVLADRVAAQGKGKEDPLTKPGECAGPKSVKVVACLQRDRRVDIDVATVSFPRA